MSSLCQWYSWSLCISLARFERVWMLTSASGERFGPNSWLSTGGRWSLVTETRALCSTCVPMMLGSFDLQQEGLVNAASAPPRAHSPARIWSDRWAWPVIESATGADCCTRVPGSALSAGAFDFCEGVG